MLLLFFNPHYYNVQHPGSGPTCAIPSTAPSFDASCSACAAPPLWENCTHPYLTALNFACENGHTDVADLLLQHSAQLEHESEGGRTPLMKAARTGHLSTVQFLISRGVDVNQQTTNKDHTPLILA